MKLGDSHEWLMWRAANGSFDKPISKPSPKLNLYPTAVLSPPPRKEPCTPTPKPQRSWAEYVDERRERSFRKRAMTAMQERLVDALIRGKGSASVEAELGYSMEQLRDHLQRQFASGMSWSNHASALPYRSPRRKWAIDHVVPKSSFDSAKDAFALSNLRPLWWKANMRKAAIRTHLI